MFFKKKHVALLGSTGSIGRQAIDVILSHKNNFVVEVLTANTNSDLLISQAKKTLPSSVVIVDDSKYLVVKNALSPLGIKVYSGEKALEDLMSLESIDIVLTAIVGYAGLKPTIAAVKNGKNIALANKETLVVAGGLITSLCKSFGSFIYPVDSEHSAIFQCLLGEDSSFLEKIFLTASGGPFKGFSSSFLKKATASQALKHPTWNMGEKITIDSASLMNKGLEVIEAKWLFDVSIDKIDVVVHPQSIIHSAVEFNDGSIKAQLGAPDMKLPIQYALGFPFRLKNTFRRFSFFDYPDFSFEAPDLKTFRNLSLAYYAGKKDGNSPCVLNAANEIAVDAFLNNKIGFLNMSDLIEVCLEKITFVENPSYEDLIETDKETRVLAKTLL